MQIFQGKSLHNLYDLEFYIHDWKVKRTMKPIPSFEVTWLHDLETSNSPDLFFYRK